MHTIHRNYLSISDSVEQELSGVTAGLRVGFRFTLLEPLLPRQDLNPHTGSPPLMASTSCYKIQKNPSEG